MKSIMEEASSIIKAIEKGWITAGKPKEFTIKIFEEPQKNFIGMTTKPAKVALIFSETPMHAEAKPRRGRTPAPRDERPTQEDRRDERRDSGRRDDRRDQQRPARQAARPPQEEAQKPVKTVEQAMSSAERLEKLGPVWTDEMVLSAQEWLNEILTMIDVKVPFTVTPERFHLKVEFTGQVYEETKREKHLFASISHLLLTMLKRTYKRPLKGYKIVLTGT